MKNLTLLFGLLLSLNVFASPITVDVISAPSGLTIQNGNATFTLPTGNVTEQILTASSNVAHQLKVIYDVGAMGGTSVGTITLTSAIPAKGIITKVWMDTITTPVSLVGQPYLQVSAASAGDIVAGTAAGGFSGVQTAIEDGTATHALKVTTAPTITVAVKNGSISAGRIAFFFEYLLSN